MTAAGTGICDGCDREGPVQQLEEVILPNGAMIVCPECRYHAEELAERSTADCEGCGDTVTAATLSRTELPDDTEMVLCADCRAAVEAGETPAGASTGSTADAGASGDTSRSSAASASDGTGSTASESGARTGSPNAGGSDAGTAASSSTAASTGDAVTDGATSKPATTSNTCDQCGGLYSIELYKVTTVDGRTEEFCPDCKDQGIDEGIVRDVELRRAQAYEVLGVEGSADGDEIRQAYLEQVKEVHPDRSDGSRSEFMLVQQAYERLRDD